MHIKILVLLTSITACTPSNRVSLAYINSIQVMQQYHGTVAKRQQLELQATRWQHDLDSVTTVIGTRHIPGIEQAKQVARYRTTLQQQLQKASQQADQELLKAVNKYLREYGAQHHYDFILAATESGNIVYAAPQCDLTQKVVQGLNQQYDKQHTSAPHQ